MCTTVKETECCDVIQTIVLCVPTLSSTSRTVVIYEASDVM